MSYNSQRWRRDIDDAAAAWSVWRWPMSMCRTSPNVRRTPAIIIASDVCGLVDQSLIDSVHPAGTHLPHAVLAVRDTTHVETSGHPVAVNASTVINLVINPAISQSPAHCPYLLTTLPAHCSPSLRDNRPQSNSFPPSCLPGSRWLA